MGVVEAGEDAGFVEVCVDILGLRDSIWAGNFDRNRPVEVIVVGKIDPSEPALAQDPEDRVTPDLLDIAF